MGPKRAVKYCHLRGTTVGSVFLLASTIVCTELQPIGIQRQPLTNDNTLLLSSDKSGQTKLNWAKSDKTGPNTAKQDQKGQNRSKQYLLSLIHYPLFFKPYPSSHILNPLSVVGYHLSLFSFPFSLIPYPIPHVPYPFPYSHSLIAIPYFQSYSLFLIPNSSSHIPYP